MTAARTCAIGGMVAQEITLQAPDLVRRLIVVTGTDAIIKIVLRQRGCREWPRRGGIQHRRDGKTAG
jgi:pimeloyl-ACP methyl ester carboxylesterase